jgi:hypothetical protein
MPRVQEHEANDIIKGKAMKHYSILALVYAVTRLASLCVCWRLRPLAPTPQLERVGAPGYRLADVTRPGQSDDLLVVLAISGGGMRAAP